MATKIRGITVEIGGDASGLDKALQNINKSIKNTQNELKDVEKLLKLDPTNTELLAQKQQLLSDRVKETSEKLSMLHKAEEELRKNGVDENSEQFRTLQREIVSTEKYLADAKKAADSFSAGLAAASAKAGELSNKAKSVADATRGLSTAATGLLGAFGAAAYKAVALSDDLNTLAKQTGFSTEEIQKMQFAEDLIDVSTETMLASVKKMTQTLKSSEKSFEALGVKTRNANGEFRDATEIWYDTLDALSKVENETERDTLAMSVFGKSAAELSGIIDDGGAALRELGDQAARTGLIMDQDTLDSLNAVNDQIDTIRATATATITQTGAKALEVVGPTIEKVIGKIGDLMTWIGSLDEEQLQTILVVTAVIAAISPVAGIIGNITGAVSSFLSFAPKLGSVATKVFEFVSANPILLIAAAVATVTALIIANWDKIKPVLEAIWAKIKSIAEAIASKVSSVFNTVKNAVKSAINAVISIINGLINGLNRMIGTLNQFQINIPNWVPAIGGKSFGFNIPYIGNIPMMAQGGTLANGSAVVGEYAPEILTVNQGVATVTPLRAQDQPSTMQQMAQPIQITVQSVLDGRIIGETVTTYTNNQNRRFGR